MQDAVISEWHEFFAAAETSSAALAGLLFVGLALHLDAVGADAEHRHGSRMTLASLASFLIVSQLAIIPRQTLRSLGWEIAALMVAFGVAFVISLGRVANERGKISRPLMIRAACALLLTAGGAFGGLNLVAGREDGLQWVAFTIIGGFAFAAFNSWALLIGIAGAREK